MNDEKTKKLMRQMEKRLVRGQDVTDIAQQLLDQGYDPDERRFVTMQSVRAEVGKMTREDIQKMEEWYAQQLAEFVVQFPDPEQQKTWLKTFLILKSFNSKTGKLGMGSHAELSSFVCPFAAMK